MQISCSHIFSKVSELNIFFNRRSFSTTFCKLIQLVFKKPLNFFVKSSGLLIIISFSELGKISTRTPKSPSALHLECRPFQLYLLRENFPSLNMKHRGISRVRKSFSNLFGGLPVKWHFHIFRQHPR